MKKVIFVSFTVFIISTMLAISAFAADWVSKSDELEKEMYGELVNDGLSSEPEKTVAKHFVECAAVNLLAKMDKYSCSDLGGPISESFNACTDESPKLAIEGAEVMRTCLESAIDNLEGN